MCFSHPVIAGLQQAGDFDEMAQEWFSNNEGVRASSLNSSTTIIMKKEEVIVKIINKKRVKIIIDLSSRKAIYKKRRVGLLKKTNCMMSDYPIPTMCFSHPVIAGLQQAGEFEMAQESFSNNEGVRGIQSQLINNEEVIVKTINKRRVKLQLIIDPSSRKATYKKRRAGLLKKIEQLRILCGIKACIVIFGPGDTKPTVWPSVEEASQIVQKFEEIPELERYNRSISHQQYRQQRLVGMEKQLEKLKKLNDQKEMTIFVHQICKEGKLLSDFNEDELKRLLTYVDDKLKDVRNSKMSSSSVPAGVSVPQLIISSEDNTITPDELLSIAEQQTNNFEGVVPKYNEELDDDFFCGLFDESGSLLFPPNENESVVPPPEDGKLS
ncbi:hypothetical protein PIB30_002637 [Stylosanthes scabra]|uniref:MADS-box domain-containing protein n=1 Tax=Stylosanthes scabra TaxID=79078 RepID=A0ABU6Q2X8_9FABA|nr:hypothetical protein [Stylosanthes scabra]